MFVVLGIQHAISQHHIVMCDLSGFAVIILITIDVFVNGSWVDLTLVPQYTFTHK
jgi:hypothetical protein